MTLREFVSEQMNLIFDALKRGQSPPVGTYEAESLRECQRRSQVRTGVTRFLPDSALFEFIFNDPSLGPAVLTVKVAAPEPIVYMPVPGWVIEDVWQGDVTGSFRFHSEAVQLIEVFQNELRAENNQKYFEDRQPPKRRE